MNENRLKEQANQLDSLKRTVRLLGNVAGSKHLTTGEANGLFKVLTDYTYALDVLDKYDHRALTIGQQTDCGILICLVPGKKWNII